MRHRDHGLLHLQDIVDTQQLIIVPKRKTMDKINHAKRLRKLMTLCQEIKVLDTLAKGESVVFVGRHYRINESTMCKHEANL